MKYVASAAVAALALVSVTAATQAVELGYANFDTRAQGAFAADSFSNDGDGSLKLQTFDNSSQGKVSVVFGTGPGQSLGTLGNLNALALEYFKSSTPATGAANTFAFRLWTNTTGTQALVWENNYNGNANVPLDQWVSASILGGNFWQRANGANFNGGAQALPLSQWIAGASFNTDGNGAAANSAVLSASTNIYGFEVAFGSGVSAFTGYVDNISLGFNGGASYTADVQAVPTPAAATAGLALLGALAAKRTRRQA